MIQPRRLGRYLETDSDGYIVPDVARDQILSIYRPMIEFVTDSLIKTGKVEAVYLRGSIPRGLAIPGVSDADFIYFAEHPLVETESKIRNEVQFRFPFVQGLELSRESRSDRGKVFWKPWQTRPYVQMLLKTQGLFLGGKNELSKLDRFRPNVEMVSHAFNLSREFAKLPKWIAEDQNEADRAKTRRWFYRRVVRAGLEVTLPILPRFTRDLYLCYEQFAMVYPQYAFEMYRVLIQALNGDDDPLQYRALIHFLNEKAQTLKDQPSTIRHRLA